MSEMTAPFCHPRQSVAGNYLVAVIPAVSGGYPSVQTKDGFPIKDVGNDNLTLSSPQVVGGDPSSP